MATYLELYNLSQDQDLRQRSAVAVLVAADEIINELDTVPNHTERVAWAARALAFPAQEGQRMLGAVLAGNSGLTVVQITGASDAALQGKVDAAVDTVALGTA